MRKVGDLPWYGTVWFYEDDIANILSLNIKKKYHVTYDSTACDCLKCTKRTVLKVYLIHPEKGLFYSSVSNDVALITTVEDKIHKHTVREYSYAKKACEFQNIIGRPSTQDLNIYID